MCGGRFNVLYIIGRFLKLSCVFVSYQNAIQLVVVIVPDFKYGLLKLQHIKGQGNWVSWIGLDLFS